MPDPNQDTETGETTDEHESEDAGGPAESIQASSTYKIRGEFADESGASVLGINNATSGTPIGVEGAVPNASGGYGLSTPDDARVAGTLRTTGSHEVIVDGNRGLEIESEDQGTTGNAGNVVAGHSSNAVATGNGSVIGGGGFADGSTFQPNTVYDNFGTVGGGRGNTAGTDDGDPSTAPYTTISGGRNNEASAYGAAVGGGNTNAATGNYATIPGGQNNQATANYSFAAGRYASVDHAGSYVFADNSLNTFASTTSGEARFETTVRSTTFGTTSARGTVTVDVAGKRALKLEPEDQGTTGNAGNVVHGHSANSVNDTAQAATIGGGGFNDGSTSNENEVWSEFTTVAGGEANKAGAPSNPPGGAHASIGGGKNNTASGNGATVGGGYDNTAHESNATVAGGEDNTASGFETTVGGGSNNSATGEGSTVAGGTYNDASGTSGTVAGGKNNNASGLGAAVPGGLSNTADGDYSFVVGRNASSNGYSGAFVVGDSSSSSFNAGSADEAWFEMPVNATSFNSTSARTEKTAIEPVDPTEILEDVRSLSVSTWEFTDTDDGRHLGPMAGEFHDTFGLGDDRESIASVDADGVALAAIQGLTRRLDGADDRIDDLESENEQLRETLAEKDDRIQDLENRLAFVEAQMATDFDSVDD